ncbi:recombinase family protein [Micromonospora sp. LOL_014]|uniref:recombinase family protein n=1 Tax=Micromonospora sp. LOL_014 TaxID=3345415 RepID=UPI003A88120B
MPRRSLAAVPDQPGRVALYVRVSALMGRAGDDFHSPDVQLGAMRRVVAGMREIAVVEDIDRTGRHFSREGIERIRAMVLARQIDAIAVYDVSRLGRNVLESLLFLRELADAGVTIISATEQIDTSTPAGEMMLINMLNIAQYRSREIGRGWSGTIARRAERGQHHGRPLGYVKVNRQLRPDPTLGPAVTEVFRRYAAGDPVGEIAGYLAAIRGKPMITANVKKMLRNPSYLGKVVAAGQVLDGTHDALTDPDTWERVQRRLAAEAGVPPRHLAPTWSMVGLAVCPDGHGLQRQGSRLVDGHGRGDVKGGTCPGVGRPLIARVEAEVLRQVANWAARLRTDHVARATRLAQLSAARADRATLERQVADARQAMVKLAKDHAMSRLPVEVYQQALAELRDAEQTAAAELARLGDVDESPDPEVAARGVDALLALWKLPEATHADRVKALRSVVDRVVVRAAARWREPEADRVEVRFRW